MYTMILLDGHMSCMPVVEDALCHHCAHEKVDCFQEYFVQQLRYFISEPD